MSIAWTQARMLLKKTELTQKTEAVLPYTLLGLRAHHSDLCYPFTVTLFMCMQNSYSRESIELSKEWLRNYRAAQIHQPKPIPFKLPKPIRVKTGKPVLGDESRVNVFIGYSEYTDNTCTFKPNLKDLTSTLIVNEDHVDFELREGFYMASVTVDAPKEFWNLDEKKSKWICNTNSNVRGSILVTIEEYVGPPTPLPQEPERLHHLYTVLPQNVKELIIDFKKTFNI